MPTISWPTVWLANGNAYSITTARQPGSLPYKYCNQLALILLFHSLVLRPLPGFISQLWRKIRRRPGIKTTSRTGNGGLGQYIMWTHFVLTESTISGSFDPRPSPNFSPRLRDKNLGGAWGRGYSVHTPNAYTN